MAKLNSLIMNLKIGFLWRFDFEVVSKLRCCFGIIYSIVLSNKWRMSLINQRIVAHEDKTFSANSGGVELLTIGNPSCVLSNLKANNLKCIWLQVHVHVQPNFNHMFPYLSTALITQQCLCYQQLSSLLTDFLLDLKFFALCRNLILRANDIAIVNHETNLTWKKVIDLQWAIIQQSN